MSPRIAIVAPVLGAAAAGSGALIAIVTRQNDLHNGYILGVDAVKLSLLLSLMAVQIGTYLVWPSRWNVWAHLQLAFSVAAYVVPILFLNELSTFPRSLVESYAYIATIGAVFYLFGLWFGLQAYRRLGIQGWIRSIDVSDARVADIVPGRVYRLVVAASAGMLLSFAVMRFIPAFAADPLQAKFFRGPYEASYQKVAPVFRISFSVLSTLLPVLLACWWDTRQRKFLVMGGISALLMLVTLQRSPATIGFLTFIGVLVAYRGRGLFWYLLLLIAAYFIGSLLYAFLSALGVSSFSSIAGEGSTNILNSVASGAPDVSDTLGFLFHWMAQPVLTEGRTFYGGLLPWHYQWSPNVWALEVVDPGTQVSKIVSGGLRLPVPVWGYVSFGEVGVLFIPLISGALAGIASCCARDLIGKGTVLRNTTILVIYTTVGYQLWRFYLLLSEGVVAGVVAVYLLFGVAERIRGQERYPMSLAGHKAKLRGIASASAVDPS